MLRMDTWDIVLYGGAALIAVVSLARLMRARREELIADVRRQWQDARARQKEP